MQKKGKERSRIVGLRVTKDQETILSDIQKRSRLSKTEILLRGLELIAEYYSLEGEKEPMELGLRRLEKEALYHMESLKSIRRKEEAIRDFVREIRFADEIIDRYGCDKSMLIQILLEVQKQRNWLPKPALLWISERLGIPLSRIRQIASFYTAFSEEPQGRHICRVCTGTACHVRGSKSLLTRVSEVMHVQPGGTDPQQKFTLKTVNCLGCCAMGPIMTIEGDYYSNPSIDQLRRLADKYE